MGVEENLHHIAENRFLNIAKCAGPSSQNRFFASRGTSFQGSVDFGGIIKSYCLKRKRIIFYHMIDFSKNDLSSRVIGFDLDGVIIDHTQAKVELARHFGIIISPEETRSDILKNIIPPNIISDFQAMLYENTDILSASRPLVAGAREGILALREKNIPLILITRRRHGASRQQAEMILRHHSLWPDFFNPGNTFFVQSGEEKNIYAQKSGVTHYLDDELKVLSEMKDIPQRFLFDPFSATSQFEWYRSVSSWDEFLQNIFSAAK